MYIVGNLLNAEANKVHPRDYQSVCRKQKNSNWSVVASDRIYPPSGRQKKYLYPGNFFIHNLFTDSLCVKNKNVNIS